MMHDRAWRALGAASLYSFSIACAGGETPATDAELREQIAARYVDGEGAVGSGGASGSGSGGSGGSAQAAAGAAGDGNEPIGGGGSGSTGGACDGFAILAANCGSAACHGDGSVYSDFAASDAAARAFVDESGVSSCATEGPLLDPENPAASIIVQKVTAAVPPCGGPMPIVGDRLPQADVACLQEWIGTL